MRHGRKGPNQEEGSAGIVGGGGRGIEEIGARTHCRCWSLGCSWGSDDGSREEPGDVRRCEWRGSRSTQRTSEALGGSTRRTNDGIREQVTRQKKGPFGCKNRFRFKVNRLE
jgi:hypothetical protein